MSKQYDIYIKDGTAHIYPLVKGDYIQLIFLSNLRIPFCTIRKAWPPSKVEYYTAAIGETFAIVVKEGAGK